MKQPTLIKDPRPVDVEHMIAMIRGQGWVSAKNLAAILETSTREVRVLVHAAKGRVISNTAKGYKLTAQATIEEINHARASLNSRRREIEQRVIDLDNAFHRRAA